MPDVLLADELLEPLEPPELLLADELLEPLEPPELLLADELLEPPELLLVEEELEPLLDDSPSSPPQAMAMTPTTAESDEARSSLRFGFICEQGSHTEARSQRNLPLIDRRWRRFCMRVQLQRLLRRGRFGRRRRGCGGGGGRG